MACSLKYTGKRVFNLGRRIIAQGLDGAMFLARYIAKIDQAHSFSVNASVVDI